jgi:Calpain family cysteine protease.
MASEDDPLLKGERDCLLDCDKQGAIGVARDEEACATCGGGCQEFWCNFHWWLLACLLNTIFSPIVLMYYAIKLYVVPCLSMYIDKCCLGCLSKICCDSCFRFTDSEFPPNSASLGDVSAGFEKGTAPPEPGCCEARQYLETGGSVHWKRGNEFLQAHTQDGEEVKLFAGGVEPADVAQGQLGNCWLLAALATLADHKGAIESCFISKQMNPRGKYRVQLFDPVEDGFEVITVDDYIPCDKDRSTRLHQAQ